MGMLDGKVALITGTGRGQGRSAALAFIREGAKVVGVDLLARRTRRPPRSSAMRVAR